MLRAANDAIFRSLLLLLPLFFFSFSSLSLLLSFFFIFSIREIPRDTRATRRKRSGRESRSMFRHQVFRIPSLPFGYSPLGSLNEIDRKLFDIFALWRIRGEGDNYTRNHISFHFYLLCSVATNVLRFSYTFIRFVLITTIRGKT